jgi:hypothetical protein
MTWGFRGPLRRVFDVPDAPADSAPALPGRGRFRYDDATKLWFMSADGGEYTQVPLLWAALQISWPATGDATVLRATSRFSGVVTSPTELELTFNAPGIPRSKTLSTVQTIGPMGVEDLTYALSHVSDTQKNVERSTAKASEIDVVILLLP